MFHTSTHCVSLSRCVFLYLLSFSGCCYYSSNYDSFLFRRCLMVCLSIPKVSLWDGKMCWGESWKALSRMHSGSWMIVSACIHLVTALCRVSLVWVSAPLLQLNLPYHCSSKAACRIVPVRMMRTLRCPKDTSYHYITGDVFFMECAGGTIMLHLLVWCTMDL